MLSKTDAWKLMTAIKHLDGRSADIDDAVLFAGVVNSSVDTDYGHAMSAVAEWYGRRHDFGRIQPGDVVEIVKSRRPSSSLSEAEIGRMLEPLDLSADEQWAARRALIANANAGMSREQALAKALDMARGHLLPAAPEKHKPTNNHHFAGRLGLADIIGKETK
jgi:hypothetical protein